MDTTPTTVDDVPRWTIEDLDDDDLAPPGYAPGDGYPDSPTSHDCTGGEGHEEGVAGLVDADVVLPDPDVPYFGVERLQDTADADVHTRHADGEPSDG
jgi:hypothetical protein